MKKDYIIKKNGGYYITDSRVALESVVYMFRDGRSPESIRGSFPVLTLEEVYGAIAFYLANQKKVDRYIIESEKEFELFRKKNHEELRRTAPGLVKKLKQARAQLK